MKTFAVIAAKNEEKYISAVVRQIKKHVHSVIVVDDGSLDKTRQRAEKAGAIVLEHVVNLGKGAATKTGIEYAISHGAQAIVLIDGDGQHAPKEIPKILNKLKQCDIVFGIRTRRKHMPSVLKFGNWVINEATKLLYGIYIPDTQCGFRAFKVGAYKKIRWTSSNYSMESEMIAQVGKKRLKYAFVPISTIYSDRYKGTTIIDGVKIVANLIWWKISKR
ncbi:glycosyltransferase family 2 protein [Candidatus Woesearchaeota archaeon]|nr:glycosyltransferase family 2 protein [Candidatus Woesearchaeota archaeon]